MPRRQRFKPSRKPKPAIEPSDPDIIPASTGNGKPTIDQETRDMNAGQREDTVREEIHPDDVEREVR